MTSQMFYITSIALLAALFCPAHPVAAQGQTPVPSPRTIYANGYPRLAHLAAVEGDVKLIAQVSPRGSVQSVRVVSGPALLAEPAKSLLSKWIFDPCDEKRCEAPITFHFILDPGMCDKSDCPTEVQIDLPGEITMRAKHMPAIVN
jgi:Gram-negative bacterial TonB protein C-terminal